MSLRLKGLIETTLNYGGMRLFLGGLPSAYLLLEDVLRSAQYLLGVRNPSLQLTSIRIVTSVLCYLKTLPKHFEVFSPTGNALPDVQLVIREELEQKLYDVIFRYTEAEYPPLIRCAYPVVASYSFPFSWLTILFVSEFPPSTASGGFSHACWTRTKILTCRSQKSSLAVCSAHFANARTRELQKRPTSSSC